MKARKKNSNNEWAEIKYVQLDNSDILYKQEYLEFDAISAESETISQITNEPHWQEVRERAAIAAMQGMLSCGESAFSYRGVTEEIAKVAVDYADSLIEKLKNK